MIRSASGLISLILLAAVLSFDVEAKVYQSFGQLDPRANYDFIVVGSGPGGSTVASRLSDDSTIAVLLIEAGPDNEGVLTIQIPALSTQIPAAYQWNYTTRASASLNNRTLPYARGYVLGGTSSINGMVYTRGTVEDYGALAKVSGDPNWNWDAIWPFIQKNERLVPPEGGRNTTGEYDPLLHGYYGNTFVSLPTSGANDFDQRCLQTSQTQAEFSFNLDMNCGRPLGLGWVQSTIGNGERASAATSYLNTTVRNRPNLSILINTYVTRVLPTGDSTTPLSLRTVEVGDRSSKRVLGTVTATKEVVLSAGVFGSPQILLNSGIGSGKELREVGVRPIHELPDVGKNMADHAGSAAAWLVKETPPPVDPSAALEQWTQNGTGSFSESGSGHLFLWSRIPSSSPVWKTYPDPASGAHTPHIETLMMGTLGQNVVGAFVVNVKPTSRGAVTLRSSNPFDDPLIDPGILKTEYDVLAMREGFKLASRFFSGPAWSGYLLNATFPDPVTASDATWETYIRESIITSLHAVGTASISEAGAKSGVVDPDLRVKGVSGIRIVDASVLPLVPAAHTQVPTYIIAERAASLIATYWR